MASSDDEKHPFEYTVENASLQKSKEPSAKKTKQTTLGFKKKEVEPSDDSDDDDDDDLKGFDFGQHKPQPQKQTQRTVAAISSVLDDESSARSKKRKSDVAERIFVRDWPKGWKKLPDGWKGREFKNGSKGDKFWVYSHAIYGETKSREHVMERSAAEWDDMQAKKHKKKGAGAGASQEAADGAGSSQEAAFDEDDPLAALLTKKRQREEEEDAIRAEVHEEMTNRMDTGIRVNKSLMASHGIK